MRRCMFVVLIGCVLGAAGPKKDVDRIQGTWLPTAIETNGAAMEKDDLKAVKVVIRGDKYTMTRDGEIADEGTLVVKETTKPRQIDAKSTLREEQLMHGIYELKGERWKVCLAMPGNRRPEDFTAGAKSERILYILKRAGK